jgi:hypothetical protein
VSVMDLPALLLGTGIESGEIVRGCESALPSLFGYCNTADVQPQQRYASRYVWAVAAVSHLAP